MKRLCAAMLLLSSVLSGLLPAGHTRAEAAEPTVNVKLVNYLGNQSEVTIKPTDTYSLSGTGVTLKANVTYRVKTTAGGLALQEGTKLLGEFSQLRLTPSKANAVLLVNGRGYPGEMTFVKENGQYVRPVNTVPVEEYLKGVVPNEMPASWNIEALKAQAVAARTYALSYAGATIDDTIRYQVYGGYARYPNSTKAVEETYGQVLKYNGRLISAVFSASNGGKTESNANAWGGTPLPIFPIKEDPYDNAVSWGFTIQKTQIDLTGKNLADYAAWWDTANETDKVITNNIKTWMKANGYNGKEIKIVAIPKLSLYAPLSGGRVSKGDIAIDYIAKGDTDNDGALAVRRLELIGVPAAKIRALIGNRVILSYLVTEVKETDRSITVSGKGDGHGVGMSQYGAKKMGELGKKYTEILDFYYPGALLTTAYTKAEQIEPPTAEPLPPNAGNTPPTPTAPPAPTPADTKAPIIKDVKAVYVPKTNQLSVRYAINEEAAVTIYVKNASGKIVQYIQKDVKQKSGSYTTIWTVGSNRNGKYTFGIITKDAAGNVSSAVASAVVNKAVAPPKVNSVGDRSSTVTGTAEAGATIVVKAGTKTYKATAKTNGSFAVAIPRQKAGTVLTVTAIDRAGNPSQSVRLTVKDNTPPPAPKLNSITSRQSILTGKAEAGATITVKIGTKTYKTAARKDGAFSVAIGRQKTKTVLIVTVADRAGNVSAPVKVQVR
ncbi:SpoIID/LytB domain-containing protein [Geobacillus sp. C56-T2]|uniref:SpoIID/LytB domain-containing protein n=1 Tax=Geobacillus sp. C56-T2 TaxID=600773 RepID=UPI00119E72DF|nr:SpoIID/LytB domain-containing protein [Geobacillus sp. C56-T2]NNV07232.1 SpoIID/LytB domain-containing protein [Geobacillus sp. MMMUD3]TWG30504.1 SpoIID/LytB domain protein [Geobacillus sp. C56-T2]